MSQSSDQSPSAPAEIAVQSGSSGKPASDTTSKKPPKQSKLLGSSLKPQLQQKTAKRRRRNLADKRIVKAVARRGRNDLQPALTNVARPLSALKPSPVRTRVTTPELLESVIRSVKEFGLVLPILIDSNDRIIAGHTLWQAAKELGLESIDCRVADHLDEAGIQALALALNRIGEIGTFDLDLLGERMIELQSAGIDLSATGFTPPEIDQIILGVRPSEESANEDEDGDEEGELPLIARAGDLFQLGDHFLLCGDALDAAAYQRVLQGRRAHCVFSDPPYNCAIEDFVSGLGKHKHGNFAMASGEMDDEAFTAFLTTYLGHCKASAAKGAVIFACMDWRQIEKLLAAGKAAGLVRKNIAIWDKGSGAMGSLYRSAYEMIAVFCNGKTPATNNVELGIHGRDRTNVWTYPGANRRGSSAAAGLAIHPTAKPVELVEEALLDVTARGDTVLDPFMGSGTTLIAAERCGRIACGMELDPGYVGRTILRWEHLTGDDAIHCESGLTFAELAERRADDQNEDERDL